MKRNGRGSTINHFAKCHYCRCAAGPEKELQQRVDQDDAVDKGNPSGGFANVPNVPMIKYNLSGSR